MKLDKIKFAKLVAMITSEYKYMHDEFVEALDNFIDLPAEPESVYPLNGQVEQLMAEMAKGTGKIEAIKLHRAITGMGLKESKDIVEKYWCVQRDNIKSEMITRLNGFERDSNSYNDIKDFINNYFR